MSIEAVLYINDNYSEEVNLVEIVTRSDCEIVKKNLYCAFKDCECKMEYVPRGKKIAHFKTWPLRNHSTDCIDFFVREQKKKSQKSLATSSIRLTDKHISSVLKSLISSIDETVEEKELRLQKQRAKYKGKKSNIVDKTENPIESQNIIPTTDKDADILGEGTRAPSVKRRFSISFLSEEDIGTATALQEKIENITIDDNRVIVLLQKNELKTNVYFEESFFVNSARNIDTMFKVVEKVLKRGDLVTLSCVGNVERRAGEISLVVNGQNHIRINKKPIEVFTFNHANPNLF